MAKPLGALRVPLVLLFCGLAACTGGRRAGTYVYDPCTVPEPAGNAITTARERYGYEGTTFTPLPRAEYVVVDTLWWPGIYVTVFVDTGYIVLLRTAEGDTLRLHAADCCMERADVEAPLEIGRSYPLDLIRVNLPERDGRERVARYYREGRLLWSVPGAVYYTDQTCGLNLRAQR
ncbi:MAG TPA: hypothetical protein VK610_07700 [Rhodothermales bacterium]|nr:hypothetical protein [Rhodothermales bacterium]